MKYIYELPSSTSLSVKIHPTDGNTPVVTNQLLAGIMERLESVGKALEVIASTMGKDWAEGYHQGEIDGYERGYQLGQEEPRRPLG